MSISNKQLFGFIKKNPISLGCALLSCGLVALLYYRNDELPAVHAALDEKSKEGERLAANVKYSNQLREQLDELIAAGKAVDSRLILSSQLANNLEYFYKLEADTNTRLLSLNQVGSSPKSVNTKSSFMPIGFTINVQGGYVQMLDVLHRLESGQHYCRVLSATCARVGVDGDLLTLNLNLELLGQK